MERAIVVIRKTLTIAENASRAQRHLELVNYVYFAAQYVGATRIKTTRSGGWRSTLPTHLLRSYQHPTARDKPAPNNSGSIELRGIDILSCVGFGVPPVSALTPAISSTNLNKNYLLYRRYLPQKR